MGKNKNKKKNEVKVPQTEPVPDNQEESKEPVQSKSQKQVIAKHFPITDKESFVQYSLQMSEAEYGRLINGDGEVIVQNPGKNKMLVQALDVSGSMNGQPLQSLIEGCIQLGNKYYASDKPAFEKLVSLAFSNEIEEEFQCDTQAEYDQRIRALHVIGGTNFYSVFERLEKILEQNPDLEELVVIFVTDGFDGHRNANMEATMKKITQKNCKVRYMSIGFSRNHDAAMMNKIANAGTEQGNFQYVDTGCNDYKEKITEALDDSFNIALGSDSSVKFRIENQQEKYTCINPAEISYVANEVQNEDEIDNDGKGPLEN